jgi:hypothetical protein
MPQLGLRPQPNRVSRKGVHDSMKDSNFRLVVSPESLWVLLVDSMVSTEGLVEPVEP